MFSTKSYLVTMLFKLGNLSWYEVRNAAVAERKAVILFEGAIPIPPCDCPATSTCATTRSGIAPLNPSCCLKIMSRTTCVIRAAASIVDEGGQQRKTWLIREWEQKLNSCFWIL
jgi:hypothetical protein